MLAFLRRSRFLLHFSPFCHNSILVFTTSRAFEEQIKLGKISSSVIKDEASNNYGKLQRTFNIKAKEHFKTVSYAGVIVFGIGIIVVVIYTIFQELYSSRSPVKLFQMASEICIHHPRIQDLLGSPIQAFGQETRRGRRRHVSHFEYVDDNGKEGIRMKFYLQGVRKRGTVQLDVRESDSGAMVTRFLIVTADDLFNTTVVIEDNRHNITTEV